MMNHLQESGQVSSGGGMLHSIWVNYNDLTNVREIIPFCGRTVQVSEICQIHPDISSNITLSNIYTWDMASTAMLNNQRVIQPSILKCGAPPVMFAVL